MARNNGASAGQETAKRATVRRSAGKTGRVVKADGGGASLSADERRALIAEAAWYRAEARGFAPGGEEADWLAAEAEVDDSLLRR
jgi:hypothetical protein